MDCADAHLSMQSSLTQKLWYLYHVRDPNSSTGVGFDSYTGITDNFSRRKYQHLHALGCGRHPNKLMQAAHNASKNGLQVWLVNVGAENEIRARAHERHYLDTAQRGCWRGDECLLNLHSRHRRWRNR